MALAFVAPGIPYIDFFFACTEFPSLTNRRLSGRELHVCHGVTPQKYFKIFIIIFIIYSGYELSQTWVFREN